MLTYTFGRGWQLLQNMTLDEAHRLALKILKEVMEEKVDENNIQLAQVRAKVAPPRQRECHADRLAFAS